MKKGFTLTELLITIVVMAVLASIAIPSFAKSAERARANQAIAYLRTIRTAEKMFFTKNGSYVSTCPTVCPAGPVTIATSTLIRNQLGAEVSTADYGFSVTQTTATFTATATRTVGGATIILYQDSKWDGTSTYLPCASGTIC